MGKGIEGNKSKERGRKRLEEKANDLGMTRHSEEEGKKKRNERG